MRRLYIAEDYDPQVDAVATLRAFPLEYVYITTEDDQLLAVTTCETLRFLGGNAEARNKLAKKLKATPKQGGERKETQQRAAAGEYV